MLYWNKQQFMTGIEPIDQQHLALYQVLYDFQEGSAMGIEDAKVKELLRFLQEYAVTHFRDEENLMARFEYPGLEEQRQEHRTFMADIAGFREEYESSGANMKLALAIFSKLGNWLAEHISMLDKEMGAYIKAQTAGENPG